VYFFPSPTNTNNVVAVMDVYPLIPASASAVTGLNTFFDQGVLYTMKFDNRYTSEATNGGRPVEDIVIQFSFGAPSNGTQQVFVYGPDSPNQTGTATTLVDGAAASASGFVNQSFQGSGLSGGVSFFAGARRDPSFFNGSQFFNIFPDANQGSTAKTCLPGGSNTCPRGFTAPATDYLGNSDVLSIVAEIPKTLLAAGNNGVIAYWATTSSSSGQ
jgi:hypothetical protein